LWSLWGQIPRNENLQDSIPTKCMSPGREFIKLKIRRRWILKNLHLSRLIDYKRIVSEVMILWNTIGIRELTSLIVGVFDEISSPFSFQSWECSLARSMALIFYNIK
jgi:hypothetical protein